MGYGNQFRPNHKPIGPNSGNLIDLTGTSEGDRVLEARMAVGHEVLSATPPPTLEQPQASAEQPAAPDSLQAGKQH